MFQNFINNKNGNVAIMFGLFLVPMLVGAGVAIDFLRANQVRSQLTDAADSALLAAVRARTLDGDLSDEQAKALAKQYFDANYRQSADVIIDTFNLTETETIESFQLTVTGSMKTSILGRYSF